MPANKQDKIKEDVRDYFRRRAAETRARKRKEKAYPLLLSACQEAFKAIKTHADDPIPVGDYDRIMQLLDKALFASECND